VLQKLLNRRRMPAFCGDHERGTGSAANVGIRAPFQQFCD